MLENELENGATSENQDPVNQDPENQLESGADESGSPGENQGKKNKLGERFSKLTGDLKAKDATIAELEETRSRERQELEEARKKLAELEAPKAPDPDLEFTDPEAYEAQKATFHEYEKQQERERIKQEVKADLASEIEQEQNAEKLEKEKAKLVAKVDNFVKRGEAVGLSEEKLEESAIALTEAGIPGDVQNLLLEDEDGAQIVDFLSDNPEQLEAMSKLSAIEQVKFIEKSVRAPATLNKPTVSGAPDPIINISGGGAREESEFEKSCPGAVFK